MDSEVAIHSIDERRAVLGAFATATAGLALPGCSRWGKRVPVLLFIGFATPRTDAGFARFSAALKALGASASLHYAQVPAEREVPDRAALAQALARVRPDAVIAVTTLRARAAIDVAAATPVLFASAQDPVKAGLVTALSAPGGNATGLWLADGLNAKRLEILRDAYPQVQTVGILVDRSWMGSGFSEQGLVEQAAQQGLQAGVQYAEADAEVKAMFERPAIAARFDAWYLPPTTIAYLAQATLHQALSRWRKPRIVSTVQEVASGEPLGFAPDSSFFWPTLAALAQRILAGEPAGQIPIEQPRRHLLALRTAPPRGLPRIAASVVRRADILY